MDQPHEIYPVSTSEAERFWTEGTDARQPATGADLQPETLNHPSDVNLSPGTPRITSESSGIDMPGVGVVRPGQVSSVCAGREGVVGVDPTGDRAGDVVDVRVQDGMEEIVITPAGVIGLEQLAAERDESPQERRDRLASQLVVVARDLALAQIEPRDGLEPAFCTECVKDAYHVDAIAHEEICRTGRVLKVVAEMIATLDEVEPQGKEIAAGSRPEADEAEPRPHGPSFFCGLCGERGGHWTADFITGSVPPLLLNQAAGNLGANGAVIYTHRCMVAGGTQ